MTWKAVFFIFQKRSKFLMTSGLQAAPSVYLIRKTKMLLISTIHFQMISNRANIYNFFK